MLFILAWLRALWPLIFAEEIIQNIGNSPISIAIIIIEYKTYHLPSRNSPKQNRWIPKFVSISSPKNVEIGWGFYFSKTWAWYRPHAWLWPPRSSQSITMDEELLDHISWMRWTSWKIKQTCIEGWSKYTFGYRTATHGGSLQLKNQPCVGELVVNVASVTEIKHPKICDCSVPCV